MAREFVPGSQRKKKKKEGKKVLERSPRAGQWAYVRDTGCDSLQATPLGPGATIATARMNDSAPLDFLPTRRPRWRGHRRRRQRAASCELRYDILLTNVELSLVASRVRRHARDEHL